MEYFFHKIKEAFPKSTIQMDKNYISFSFGGGLYYQLRLQKSNIRMMATNYPQKAKIGECFKLIRENNIEGQHINGVQIQFESGERNPEIFTLRIEIPYNSEDLASDEFAKKIIDSCEKFHFTLLPLINNFQKKPLGSLRETMGGLNVNNTSDTEITLQQKLAKEIISLFSDAVIKKIDEDNYLDIHIPSINDKKGTHIGFNTSRKKIKIVFYCRDEEFIKRIIDHSKKIEEYGQGIRPVGNPDFDEVSIAIKAATDFLMEIKRASNIESIEKVNDEIGNIKTNRSNEENQPDKKSENDFDEMVKAFKEGNIEKVASFVEKGNPPLQFNSDGTVIENELIAIVSAQEVDELKLKNAIKRGDDINVRNNDKDAYTPVHFCAWDGKDEALSILINNGAKPDIVGNDGRTALHLASALGHVSCVEQLLKAGVDIDRKVPDSNKYYSKNGATALREAFINQRWEIADLLLSAGAEIKSLSEPCVESFQGTKDLFEVVRKLNDAGEYESWMYNEEKVTALERKVKGDKVEETKPEKDLYTFKSDLNVTDSNKSEFKNFDVTDPKIIDEISSKIEKNKVLTNLLYVNRLLGQKGFSVDKHQAYFFDSEVLISDRELSGFLVVNLDGFYSNCMNKEEMTPIFSWSGVDDIEYKERGNSSSIDIISSQGRLTISKENSKSLKILSSFYRNVWKQINEHFKGSTMIFWDEVWKMGILEVGFENAEDYFKFKLADSNIDIDNNVNNKESEEKNIDNYIKEDGERFEVESIEEALSKFYCNNAWERNGYKLNKISFPDVIKNKKELDILFRKFSKDEIDGIVRKIKQANSYIILPFIKEILYRKIDLTTFKPPFWFIPFVAYGNDNTSILYFNQDGIYNILNDPENLTSVVNVDLWTDITVESGYNGLFDDETDDENISSLCIKWTNPKSGNSGAINAIEFHGKEYGSTLKIIKAIWDFAWKEVVDRSRGSSQFLLGPPPDLMSFDSWDELLNWSKSK